jgi:hypothetical protein
VLGTFAPIVHAVGDVLKVHGGQRTWHGPPRTITGTRSRSRFATGGTCRMDRVPCPDAVSDVASAPLVLVDGSSYLYRAFHALPPLTAPDGSPDRRDDTVSPTCCASCARTTRPERMAVVFDAPGRPSADDIYPEYKANRPPMPDELAPRSSPCTNSCEAMGLPLLCVEGVEADDVIATLADQAARAAARRGDLHRRQGSCAAGG